MRCDESRHGPKEDGSTPSGGRRVRISLVKQTLIVLLFLRRRAALAVMENAPFDLGHGKLEAGDFLFLHTDGINEAMSPEHAPFSCARLLGTIVGVRP